MKTLLFTLEYPPFKGGVANYYENIVKNWPEAGGIFILNNNENQLLNKYIFPKWLPSFFALKKEIKKNQIDHIIVGHILPLGTVAYLYSRIFRIEYSVILHGMDFAFSQKSARKKFLAKLILNNAKSIICANSYVAHLVKKEISQFDKIKTVNPGIDKHEVNLEVVKKIKEKYQLDEKIVMLTFSRLVKRKGQDKVIEAIPEALKHVPNLNYYIIGDGPDRKYLEEKAKDLKNVFFLGKLDDEEKFAWLEVCDFFVMPARNIDGDFDGFGIVYLEAAMARKAVIAGESGGIKDAVQGGITGVLVNPNDKEKITNAIISLATQKEIRDTLGNNAFARAEKDFHWKDKVNKIFSAINNI